ncbi:hypothetical protein C8Q80DRAFT_1215094 [Daedaleopsis nitida]|nr:hypothetical protein C8Q80DRAFT_1215094 [Daedaleopsis nitida]
MEDCQQPARRYQVEASCSRRAPQKRRPRTADAKQLEGCRQETRRKWERELITSESQASNGREGTRNSRDQARD